MEESLVQWILLKNQEQFSKILGITLGRCIGTEFTTKSGRLDFIFELDSDEILLVELETNIDSASKYEHSTDQVKRYLGLQSEFPGKRTKVALVYAEDNTPEKYHEMLKVFSEKYGVILKRYSLQKILKSYNEMVNQLYKTSGLSLSRAVALGVTSISWLKKIIAAFLESSVNSSIDVLPWAELKSRFSSSTNFYVLKRLAEDFELIEMIKKNNKKRIRLTEPGRRFRDELYLEVMFQNGELNNILSQDLTIGQKRILLEILLNGNFTKVKVNIFHFLRFIHLTEGDRIPKLSTRLTSSEKQYLNDIFRASYNSRTLKDLVSQTCTFCMELGLIERLPAKNQVNDKAMFTSLGSRVYYYFEQLLSIERERYQIPLQFC